MSYQDLWYELVSDSHLRQGDIVRGMVAFFLPQDLAVLSSDLPPGSEISVKLQWTRADWVVLDASCDIDHGPPRVPYVQQVLLALVLPASKESIEET